jgi:hypothetical protein
MTLTLTDRVRHARHSALPARLAAKAFALAVEICRCTIANKEFARFSQSDLRDIGLTSSDVGSRPLAQDVATELHVQSQLRRRNWFRH